MVCLSAIDWLDEMEVCFVRKRRKIMWLLFGDELIGFKWNACFLLIWILDGSNGMDTADDSRGF